MDFGTLAPVNVTHRVKFHSKGRYPSLKNETDTRGGLIVAAKVKLHVEALLSKQQHIRDEIMWAED